MKIIEKNTFKSLHSPKKKTNSNSITKKTTTTLCIHQETNKFKALHSPKKNAKTTRNYTTQHETIRTAWVSAMEPRAERKTKSTRDNLERYGGSPRTISEQPGPFGRPSSSGLPGNHSNHPNPSSCH